MHTMHTETANQPSHEWEPARRERLKIVSLEALMGDIDISDYWSLILHQTLKVYQASLLRRYENKPTTAADFDRICNTIIDAADILEQLQENESELMADWYYGIPTVDNVAHGLANLLCRLRVDLLVVIGAAREAGLLQA
jgi:hypothetical protein